MDSVKRLFRSFMTWYVIGYLVLVLALGFLLARAQNDRQALRAEVKRAQAFDDRRAYELCESGNEARTAIVDAFHAYTDALIAASSADTPKTPKEREERERSIRLFREQVDKRLAPLGPRDCVPPFGVKP